MIDKVCEQQKHLYENKVHSIPDRIVHISQPYIRPIVCGTAGVPVEFGAKINFSLGEKGIAKIEKLSFDAYNGSDILVAAIEWYFKRTGHYPECILTDKIYWNRNNLAYGEQGPLIRTALWQTKEKCKNCQKDGIQR